MSCQDQVSNSCMFSSRITVGPYSWMKSSSTCSRMFREFFFCGERGPGARLGNLAALLVVSTAGRMEPAPVLVIERIAEREPFVRPVRARAKPVLVLVWLLLMSVAVVGVPGWPGGTVEVLRWRAFSEVVSQRVDLSWRCKQGQRQLSLCCAW